MREIKFRAWQTTHDGKGQMINDYAVVDNNLHFIGEDLTNNGEGDIVELMQFTGMEDAQINGNEVYESDIIENCDTKALQVVYWNEDEAAWYCRYVDDQKRTVSLADSLGNLNKKVGNIYENENLLNPPSIDYITSK